ncbi:hypothetical protein RND71_043369 [Anisodus tanguticus]|uniref:SAM domain-containing protein n=1 Tax=Anisodus tanguticus TaxID=243964 RepID=A0AAE1URE7_9SOLA|nr:hypothetical protein RND71_043369 [Anisodus tanguticus]
MSNSGEIANSNSNTTNKDVVVENENELVEEYNGDEDLIDEEDEIIEEEDIGFDDDLQYEDMDDEADLEDDVDEIVYEEDDYETTKSNLINCKNEIVMESHLRNDNMKKQFTNDLLEAARTGNEDSLIAALKIFNVNCHASDGRKSTPLHLASGYNRSRIVEILLRHGADVHAQDKGGLVPLHNACSYGHYDVCETLLMAGANVNAMDFWQFTPLHEAAAKVKVELLLSYDADPNVLTPQGLTAEQIAPEPVKKLLMNHKLINNNPEYKLLESAKNGDLAIVEAILNVEPQLVNCRDLDGRQSTPLHFAAGYNHPDVVKLLLEKGADIHARDKGGLVPLHNSCSYGHYEVAELLIKYGANVNVTDLWKYSPLHEAASKSKPDIVRLLLKHGADPNKKNRNGETPSDLVKEDDIEVRDLLIGDAALLDAAKCGNLQRVIRLLTPENVNCKDTEGRNSTALHLASGYNNIEVAEYLLQNGAHVNIPDKGGLIPLHNAASYGHLDIAALLIKYNTNVNATDRWGFTPLHEASQKGRTSLCALLLNHGADPTLRNLENQTALDLATAEDVRCLLMDALAPNLETTTNNSPNAMTKDKNLNKGCTTTNTESATVISNDNTINDQTFSTENNSVSDLQKEISIFNNSNDFNFNRNLISGNNLLSNNYDVPSAASLLLLQKNSANVNEDNSPDSNKPDGNSHVTNTLHSKNKNLDAKNSSSNPNSSPQTSNGSTKKSIVSISSYIEATLPAISMVDFLTSLNLLHLIEIFEKEMITIDILAEMGHEELKQIGVAAYGHRHKLLKAVEKLLLQTAAMHQKQGNPNSYQMYVDSNPNDLSTDSHRKNLSNYSQTTLVDLLPNNPEFELVEEEMQNTIREHKDGHAGGKFNK